jgi:hypothetical protein
MRRTHVRRQFAEGNEGSLRRPSATLLVEQGHTCVRTSEQAGLPERKLRKWIKRLLELVMAGLSEQPYSGHAPLFPPAVALSVVRLACEKRLVSATLAHGVYHARYALVYAMYRSLGRRARTCILPGYMTQRRNWLACLHFSSSSVLLLPLWLEA